MIYFYIMCNLIISQQAIAIFLPNVLDVLCIYCLPATIASEQLFKQTQTQQEDKRINLNDVIMAKCVDIVALDELRLRRSTQHIGTCIQADISS